MTNPQAQNTPTTGLCRHTLTSLHYRDADLVEDLMGQKGFTEVMLMQILGRPLRPVDVRITDVVLVVLMEHGLTPSAIATRLIYMSAPENLQGAVAAGLLAVGSSFVGTMENGSRLLDRILAAPDGPAEALAIAREHRARKQAVGRVRSSGGMTYANGASGMSGRSTDSKKTGGGACAGQ